MTGRRHRTSRPVASGLLLSVGLAVVTAFSLAACASGTDPVEDGPAVSSSAPSDDHPAGEETPAGDRVRMTIDGDVFDVVLRDNPAAASLVTQLPLTLAFRDFNGVEKIASLPRALTMDGMPAGDDPDVGDLGYYAPDQVLVLYYGDVGHWNGIARLGRVDGDLSRIRNRSDGFSAVIRSVE